MFESLVVNLQRSTGYRLASGAISRIGSLLRLRVTYLVKKDRRITNRILARARRSEFWSTITLYKDEFASFPKDMFDELQKQKSETDQKQKQIEELYEAMAYLDRKRKRKSFSAVGERKQQRQTKEILLPPAVPQERPSSSLPLL
ncbi:hypothetical protein AC249_AIPGENE26001 [Exaiptasia diaphana]|nr:hypothetical protein AC249_AIPGENE26001 [Exaiptasia diaphana]